MKLVRSYGHRCTFRVECQQARQASLVIDIFPGVPQIFPLHNQGNGVWEIELRLHPGEYRFCYHLYDGRALQYVTPAGMKTDGLKAVLHVTATPEPARDETIAAEPELIRRRPSLPTPLAPVHQSDDLRPGFCRRAAG